MTRLRVIRCDNCGKTVDLATEGHILTEIQASNLPKGWHEMWLKNVQGHACSDDCLVAWTKAQTVKGEA